MNKNLWVVLFFIFYIMVCGKVWSQEGATIKSVSAEFIQEKHLRILSEPMISKGRLFYQAPGSLRWEYFHPVRSVLLVHDGKTRRYILKDKEIIEDSSANMQSMHIVMEEITRWLSGRFDENPDFFSESKTKNKIVLKPVKEAFSKIIYKIEIYLSDRPGVIESVIIDEGEDSFTRINFNNVQLNRELKHSLFREL